MGIKQTTITRDEIDRVLGRTSDVRHLQNLKQETETMAGRKGKRTPEESERLIREYIYQAKKPVTFLQICQYLDRKPSPHFRAMVDAMVDTGELKKTSDYGAGPSIPRHLYSVNRK